MKVHCVKLGFLALLFICLYSNVNVGHAEIVWSEDFNDGNYDGWSLNLGEVTAEDQFFRNLEGYTILSHESTITVGTWSFDAFFQKAPTEVFNVWFMSDNKFTVIPPEGWNGSAYCITVYTPPDAPQTPYVDGTKIHLRKIDGAYGHPLAMDSLAEYIAPDDLSMTWHHFDITRDENGTMTVYMDYEPIIEYTDTTINTSRYFQLYTIVKNVKFDNIIVKDIVDPPQIQEWHDDFDDGDYDGWNVAYGNWTVTNNSLQTHYHPDTPNHGGFISHPSPIAFGTWSLDVYIIPGKTIAFFPISTNHTHYEYGHLYYFDIYSNGTAQIPLVKLEGSYPEKETWLDSAFVYYHHDGWNHIDITRDIGGRFCVYFNGECIIDVVDTSVDYSEDFGIASYPFGCLIDNITVRNVVDITPPIQADVSVEISQEEIIQGEELLITVQVKDDYGDPILGLSVDAILEETMVDVSRISWGVHQAVVDTSEYLGTVELVVTAKLGFNILESTHHIEVVAPASFISSDLSIEPSTVQIGETVEISVDVSNVGGQEGSHTVVLKVNGVVEDQHEVTLELDGSETVIFEYTPTQSGDFTVDVDSLSGSFTVVEPASFELSNLIVEPTSVREGESISISVDCMNTGGVSGSYDVILMVDGETEDTSTVTLDPDESTTVSFDVSATQEGTYSVEIGGLTGSYTVERLQRGIPGFPSESVILGLVSGAVLLWILQRNR